MNRVNIEVYNITCAFTDWALPRHYRLAVQCTCTVYSVHVGQAVCVYLCTVHTQGSVCVCVDMGHLWLSFTTPPIPAHPPPNMLIIAIEEIGYHQDQHNFHLVDQR